MRYQITRLVVGRTPSIDITEERFRAIVDAKQRFIAVLGIEEKFDLLLENFVEFERELLRLSLDHLVYRNQDWHSFRADDRLMGRRLANLLSSARLYIDQIKHDLSGLIGQAAVASARAQFSHAYDNSFSYRLMESLRNHFQHRGVPTVGVGYKSSWNRESEPPVLEFRVSVPLDIDVLRSDPKFKPEVLQEFLARGEKCSVVGDVREYVAKLAEVHEWLRKAMAEDVERWVTELRTVIDTAKSEFPGGRIVGLGVIARDDDLRRAYESEQVFEDMLLYRDFFLRKNGSLGTLVQRFVSSLSFPGDV